MNECVCLVCIVFHVRCRILNEKFYPGPGLDPGPLTFRANGLTNWAIQDKYESKIELISYIFPF